MLYNTGITISICPMECINTSYVCVKKDNPDKGSYIVSASDTLNLNCDESNAIIVPYSQICGALEVEFVDGEILDVNLTGGVATLSSQIGLDQDTQSLFQGWYTYQAVSTILLLFVAFFWMGQWIFRK